MHPKHPRIEALLRDAHTAEKQLRTALGKLLTFGVAADDLPNHRDIFGLALLGDHERAEVVSQLRSHWPALQERGLVAELSPDDVPTPLLRLLVYTVNHLEEIPSLLDALTYQFYSQRTTLRLFESTPMRYSGSVLSCCVQ